MVRSWYELSDYVTLKRVGGLRLSPDGRRLVAPVSGLKPDGTAFGTSLWEIDPEGRAEPRRITRSVEGEAAPAFLPDGSLLFSSKRADAESKDDGDKPALWLLPADGGEARRVATRPGGIGAVAVARDAGTVVFASDTLPGTTGAEEDEDARKARKDAGVTAILHESFPVRHWDHDLGPGEPRLFAAAPPEDASGGLGEPADLTPAPGKALEDTDFDVSPDGSTAVADWTVLGPAAQPRTRLVAIDTATGATRVLAEDPERDFSSPVFSPDGRSVAAIRSYDGAPGGEPRDATLWVLDAATGEGRDVLADSELWPREAAWSADSRSLFFIADENGRRPVFRLDLDTSRLTRVTGDDGAYSALQPAPDGAALYALRDSWDEPPTPVRLDPAPEDGRPVPPPAPDLPLEVPGRLTEVEAQADDGTRVRSWLVLPEEASADSPAPLLLWIHGGPYMSFNGWSWRWNPWLLAARGYAVLLPDPALSTGYGQDMLRRAWGTWGPRTFADLMAAVDAAAARDDVDGERTAAMGGSFGGYMANWVAGHTDRFKAVVTHASLWDLESFSSSTDLPPAWTAEFGDPDTSPERYRAASPHRAADGVRTPVLVIHGDKDYRVPIGQGLQLWWDLMRREVDAKFLYFPNENHWILTPGNIAVWYETVFAFLDHHVLGKEWKRPEHL